MNFILVTYIKGKKIFYPSLNVHPMEYLIHIDAMQPDEEDWHLLK